MLLEDNGIGREHAMKLKNNTIDNHQIKGNGTSAKKN
jgi:hypothetical protein